MTITNEWQAFQKRLAFIRPFKSRLIIALMFMFIAIGMQLLFPFAIANLLDSADQQLLDNKLVMIATGCMAAVLLYAVTSAIKYYLFESTGAMMVTRIQQTLFRKLLHNNIRFFDQVQAGELSSRLQNDVQSLRSILSIDLGIGIRSLLVILVGSGFLVSISSLLSAVLCIVYPVSFFVGRKFGNKLQMLSREIQQRFASCHQYAQESLENIRVVHAFNRDDSVASHYQNETTKALDSIVSNTKISSTFQALSQSISMSAMIVMIIVGIVLINRGQISTGELTGFVMYAAMVTNAISSLVSVWASWKQSSGATQRVFELLEGESERVKGQTIDGFSSAIRFDGVTFCYPARPELNVLQDLHLEIKKGEKIALVGASGSGKSTISKLLMGFYPATSGQITLDGVPLDNIKRDSVRKVISMVEQEPVLFSGTIAENIAFSVPERQVSQEEIIAAAKSANAHKFITQLTHGYDTRLGDRATKISGGQKQRIAIARAFLRDPQILILDEATSALDNEAEQKVQQAIEKIMEGRTTLIIAHRESSIASVDRVITLESGRILDQAMRGTIIEKDLKELAITHSPGR